MTNHKKVITLTASPAAPLRWRFFDFCYVSGSNPIEDWYSTLSDRGQTLLNALLKNNQKTENHLQWMGFRKFLKGGVMKGEGIWELGFFDERQYRLLGIFDGAKRAVFLMGCYHKGKSYTPPNALETALERKKMKGRGEYKLNERQIKTDQ